MLFLVLVLSFCIACSDVYATETLLNETLYVTTSDNMMHHVGIDFDCIDIYKQPSLNHPLLKNHKIQLYPNFTRNMVLKRPSYERKNIEGCPIGKVPFYKKTKRHQIEGFHSNSPNYHSLTIETTQSMTFHGGYAVIGAYNLHLKGKQYSLSGIWVESGPPSNLNSIFFGTWAVGSGCYNIDCPRFVQVGSYHHLGGVISPVSIIGSLDKRLLLSQSNRINQRVIGGLCIHYHQECFGYWPKELFPRLSSGASFVRYGGETYTPPGMVSPPMGSGRLPQEKYKNSGYMKNIDIINSEYKEIDIPPNMKINKGNNLNCYDLLFRGDEGSYIHQAFLYAGPGGKSC